MPDRVADLPPLEELLHEAVAVSLPMRTRFRGQAVREALLLRGPAGWAEFAPFPEYGAEESSAWLAAAAEAGWTGLGAPLRGSVPVSATMPAVAADRVPEVLARYGDGITTVKIKVAEPGQGADDDVARVSAVVHQLPGVSVRVDANAGWDVAEAAAVLPRIAEAAHGRLEYAEQPVPGVEGLARLREALHAAGHSVRIAADETVRKAEDPLRVARLGAADLLVLKVPPLGGVRRALDLVEQAGLPVVVSSALDTSIGLTAGLALASRLPQLPYACGLGTVTLFEHDVVGSPLLPADGRLGVPVRDGVIAAPEPDPELVGRARLGPERQAWWFDRVRAAHRVLASRMLE
ncbi:o-succinylbenzoate synthase [Nesterenkonia populi]